LNRPFTPWGGGVAVESIMQTVADFTTDLKVSS
jgi:hypothetical protein